MKKSIFGLTLSAMLFALCFRAEAQPQPKAPKIGLLRARLAASGTSLEGFLRELRALGYIEGQNIASEYRYAEGKQDRYPELAAELVRLKVDIIVVPGGDRPIRAAKNATKTIPIVMVGGGTAPVEAGLLKALPVPAATSPALPTLPEN